MTEPMTVKELAWYCYEQCKAGNGDKHILISDDDEGNGFHGLYYEFSKENVQEFIDSGVLDPSQVPDPDNFIILG